MADYTTSLDSGVKAAQDAARSADASRIAAQAAGAGGGVTDHGALTGLADDDHPQYAKADGTRGSFATTAQGALAATASQPGHTHSGADIASGTVGTARLGSGTASATTFLRGDQTWATPAAGSSGFGRVPKVSLYAGPSFITNTGAGTAAYGSGAVPCAYIEIASPITIDQLGFRVATAEAGMNAKALLYSSDTDGYPATLVANSGALSCAATGDVFGTLGTPVVLPAGLYWAFIRSNTGTTVRFFGCQQTPRTVSGSSTAYIWQSGNFLTANPGTYATPANITSWAEDALATAATLPLVYLRRSA